jgi:outer membrane protein assembly factor BamB
MMKKSIFAWVDGVAIAAVVLLGIELAMLVVMRGPARFGGALLTSAGAFAAAIALGALVLAIRGRFGRGPRLASLVLVYIGIVAGIKVFSRRWSWEPERNAHLEVVHSDSTLLKLTPDQQLRWAVRVAAHAVSTGGRAGAVLNIPSSWLYPPNAQIGVREFSDSMVLSAEDQTGRSCRFTLYSRVPQSASHAGRHDPLSCRENGTVTNGYQQLTVQRRDWSPPSHGIRQAGASPGAWVQYRRDASRSASATSGNAKASSWTTHLDGEVRSTASIVGSTVLLGTHGPGALHAFDVRSGRQLWMRYEPNWIHQDAVSNGQTVLAGFGDNRASLFGDSPAGVSAFSLTTGELQWSAFEGNSVMTSPVIWRDRAVYITSAGVLKVRDISSGTETGRFRLPGRATMAPPALLGDTLVASLDSAQVCALRLQPLDRLWCTRLPNAGMLGHAAPTVIGDRVYATGGIFNNARTLGMSRNTWLQVKELMGWTDTRADFHYEGQQVWALDLATGRVAWESKVYPSRRSPSGHSSGTMIGANGIAVVLLPLAERMVAFDPQSGRELWTQDVGGSRGPVAHLGDRLFLTLQSGELRVVRASSGAIECSIRTSATFDRAGPAIADSTLFFGSEAGRFMALPLATLTHCAADEVRLLVH